VAQALELLSAHRDTVIILLKNEADHASLYIIEEVHLLIALCTNVLPLVPRPDLVRTGFFGASTCNNHPQRRALPTPVSVVFTLPF
jgi:hypothetical protein